MSLNLEDRLLQYDKNKKITNDKELIEAIENLLTEESSLPAEERDYDFVEEAIDTLNSMKGNGLSDEKIDALSRKVMNRCLNQIADNEAQKQEHSKSKVICIQWKRLIPAAVIATIFTITVTAYAMGFDLLSMSKQAIDNLLEKVVYQNGNYELIKTSDFEEYVSIQEYLDSNPDAVLLLPNEIGKDGSIMVIDYGIYTVISIDYGLEKDNILLTIRTPENSDLKDLQTEIVNGIPVHFTMYNDIYQGEFSYKKNYYIVRAASKEKLEAVIKKLEEKAN